MTPAELGYTMPAEWAPPRPLLDGVAETRPLWREHLEEAQGYVRVARGHCELTSRSR